MSHPARSGPARGSSRGRRFPAPAGLLHAPRRNPGRAWTGYSPQIRAEISAKVESCFAQGCPDSRSLIDAGDSGPAVLVPAMRPVAEEVDAVLDVPLVGKVNLIFQPLLLSTSLIAFVDGFNPCSIWVLTMLLVLVLHSGSRRRVLLVGLTFLFTTALIYGMFIAGVFSILAFVSYLPWIYWVVALFALTGLIILLHRILNLQHDTDAGFRDTWHGQPRPCICRRTGPGRAGQGEDARRGGGGRARLGRQGQEPDFERGEVKFGDGVHGRRPPPPKGDF